MNMSEFKDFVEDCRLTTKEVGFERMTTVFIKANAVNTAQVRQQHADERRNAGGKAHEKPAARAAKVAGTNEGGEAWCGNIAVFASVPPESATLVPAGWHYSAAHCVVENGRAGPTPAGRPALQ